MRDGLKIVTLPGGYYPYVLVGWLVRVQGDEYEMRGARVIRRFGRNNQLRQLADRGPLVGTELLDAGTEEFHRLQFGRCIPCNVGAWMQECPKPKDWVDS